MHAIFKATMALMLASQLGCLTSFGQEEAGLAYLRFANVTGHPGKLFVKLDGMDINPDGYVDGQSTGAVGFPAKSCQIELKHETLGDQRLAVDIKLGEVTTVVALPLVEEKKKEDEEPKVTLTHQVIEAKKHKQGQPSTITLVQSSPAATLDFTVGGKPLAAEKLKPITTPLTQGMGDFVAIKLGDKTLTTLNCTDPTDHVLLFFTDKSGVLKNVSFHNSVD